MYNAMEDGFQVEQRALSPTNMDEINELITELQGDETDCVILDMKRETLEGNYVNDVIASRQNEVDNFFPMNNETSEINKVFAAGKFHGGIQQSSVSNEFILNNSLHADPKLSASTRFWSSMIEQYGRANPNMNVKSPVLNSWTSSGSTPPSYSSQSIGLSSGTTQSIKLQCPKVIPTRGVFALAPDHAVNNTTSTVQFGPIAPGYVQPYSSSWNQMSPFIGNASPGVPSSGLLGQNLFSHKRGRMSAFGSASSTIRMPQIFDPPTLVPSVPMEHQLDYVKTWEGRISGILQNRVISFMEARVYRKVTSRDTERNVLADIFANQGIDHDGFVCHDVIRSLTVGWPKLLQISRTIRQNIINNSLSTYRGPVDYVIFEIIGCNDDLHGCLRSWDSCAKLDLHSQTLLLSSTNVGNRFIGTVLQGKHGFPALQFTYGSSSRGVKALRLR